MQYIAILILIVVIHDRNLTVISNNRVLFITKWRHLIIMYVRRNFLSWQVSVSNHDADWRQYEKQVKWIYLCVCVDVSLTDLSERTCGHNPWNHTGKAFLLQNNTQRHWH